MNKIVFQLNTFRWALIFIFFIQVVACNQDAITDNMLGDEGEEFPIETIVEDGVWCWFSDPRAIYFQGESEVIFLGYINQNGDVMISEYDIDSKEVKSFTLNEGLEVDDHNVPTILILTDGHILTFYNEHNGNIYMRRSVRPGDITKWEPEQIIIHETDEYVYTYTNPVQLSSENGRIYIFGRKVGPNKTFDNWWPYYIFSDDEGKTWSEDVIILDNKGRVNPPYMKVSSDNKSRIDILFTDGHPKIDDDVSVFHMYYENEQFFQTDGAFISEKGDLPIPIASVDKVYDASKSRIRSWIWDISLNGQNNPVITYGRFPTENDHRYHYTYWDGENWIDQEICKSGGWMPSLRQGDLVREAHYSGGVVLDHNNTDLVYLSRQINGIFEVEKMKLNADGSWESMLITSDSDENNVRPYVVYQSPKEKAYVLWMNGIYRHYTNYSTNIQLFSH